MISLVSRLCYGINENISKDLLYIDKIILKNYDYPQKNKKIMEELGKKYNIYQYNCNKTKNSNYFCWQNVENGVIDYTHIELSIFKDSLNYHTKMLILLNDIFKLNIDVEIEIEYNNIEKLIEYIKKEIETEETKYIKYLENLKK